MPTLPLIPTDERLVLKGIKNHAEFRKKLNELSMTQDLKLFDAKVAGVARCWFKLAQEHLAEARSAEKSNCNRSAYSRAYYAAYNASKSVRYIVKGEVSLTGEDHSRASELPDDFPQVAKWTPLIAGLFEHRLRADYENWTNTLRENTMSATDCIRQASDFINECHSYINSKFGVQL